jgi:hypothetical protein
MLPQGRRPSLAVGAGKFQIIESAWEATQDLIYSMKNE